MGFAAAIDLSNVITRLESADEARALPRGVVVGDQVGGVTFNDAIAAVLESRSNSGWQKIEEWTVIVIER
jgi:hypothetical protein